MRSHFKKLEKFWGVYHIWVLNYFQYTINEIIRQSSKTVMSSLSQMRSAPKQMGFNEAKVLSQFDTIDKGIPSENCQRILNIFICWRWHWTSCKAAIGTNKVQQRTFIKRYIILIWGLKFHVCSPHWIQYSLGFHRCRKGYQVARILANKIKIWTVNWLTFCMDYHMLKNQNFSLASIQPCVSLPFCPNWSWWRLVNSNTLQCREH